jgi:putative two-component system hydrogenase maturation factor HypX/HoxX
MGVREALRLGLIDRALPAAGGEPLEMILAWAQELAADTALPARIAEKRRRRARDEETKALEQYRAEELERMYRNFYGFDPSYHVARHNFIYKVPKSRTPLHLAPHRARTLGRRAAALGGSVHEEMTHV